MVKFYQFNIFAGTSDTRLFFPLAEALRILVPSFFPAHLKKTPHSSLVYEMSTDRIRWRGNICGAVIGSRPQSLFIFCDWALSHERTYITCLYHLQPRPAVIKKGFWKTLNQSSSGGMKVVVLVEGGSEDEGVVYVWVFCFVSCCWLLDLTEN